MRANANFHFRFREAVGPRDRIEISFVFSPLFWKHREAPSLLESFFWECRPSWGNFSCLIWIFALKYEIFHQEFTAYCQRMKFIPPLADTIMEVVSSVEYSNWTQCEVERSGKAVKKKFFCLQFFLLSYWVWKLAENPTSSTLYPACLPFSLR